MLHLTKEQKAAPCAARRQYLSSVMRIAKQRKLLLQQMQDMPAVWLDGSQLEATSDTEEDLLRKLHAYTLQANAAFVSLQVSTGHQVNHVSNCGQSSSPCRQEFPKITGPVCSARFDYVCVSVPVCATLHALSSCIACA